MSEKQLEAKYLFFVRHGQSEGDLRRLEQRPQSPNDKHPNEEGQTEAGHAQSQAAGAWISKFIINNDIKIDAFLTSPLPRTQESAKSLGISDNWKAEPRLTERNRGKLHGLTRQQFQELHPENYLESRERPFYWTPINGESLFDISRSRILPLISDISTRHNNAVLMTHRDIMWTAQLPLKVLTKEQIEQVNTDMIGNGHIDSYTNVSPYDGSLSSDFRWHLSVDPTDSQQAQDDNLNWQDLYKLHPNRGGLINL